MTKHSENTEPSNSTKTVLTTVFLVPYLPYDLKGIVYYTETDTEIIKLSTKDGLDDEVSIHNWFIGYPCKPILKPLSDLIDNILEDGNDENYELHLQLSELLNTNDCSYFVKALIDNKYYAVDVRLWNDIEEWLNKNHFDWKFNLIEKGLAVSIHDVA